MENTEVKNLPNGITLTMTTDLVIKRANFDFVSLDIFSVMTRDLSRYQISTVNGSLSFNSICSCVKDCHLRLASATEASIVYVCPVYAYIHNIMYYIHTHLQIHVLASTGTQMLGQLEYGDASFVM